MIDEFLNTRVDIQVTLSDPAAGLVVNRFRFAELSLPCCDCLRVRTVAVATSDDDVAGMRRSVSSYCGDLPPNESRSICLSAGHTFPAEQTGFKTIQRDDAIVLRLSVDYRFEEFETKDRSRRRPVTQDCSWIRLSFEMSCPECGTQRNHSVQSNLVRPHKAKCKSCGVKLFVDAVTPEIQTRSKSSE